MIGLTADVNSLGKATSTLGKGEGQVFEFPDEIF